MTELEALKEQIALLKEQIRLQAELIQELRKSVPLPIVTIPSQWPVQLPGCQHEYPNPWFATIPPSCKKCGQQAPAYTVTCSV